MANRSARKSVRESEQDRDHMPEPVAQVFVTTAIRTSGGIGPGAFTLPNREAGGW